MTLLIRTVVVVVLLSSIAQVASAADTTWIDGTVTSVTKRPMRVAHAMLAVLSARTTYLERRRIALGPLDETPRLPLAVVSADANGNFRIGTVEKGLLLLRITSPDHAPVEWPVYCSGGHTIRLVAVASAWFTPTDAFDTVSVVTRDSTIALKRLSKGLYGATIKTKDSVVDYYVQAKVHGANLPISGVGNLASLNKGSKNTTSAPDNDGVYWSATRASKGVARIQANTNTWLRSNEPSTMTFLSLDDATIDSLMSVIGQRVHPDSATNSRHKTFESYNDRSDRVRQVAALAYSVPWDKLKTIVPPTSTAWTVGNMRFFDLLMQSGMNADMWDYIDTLLTRHPVRRIIPAMQSAAIGYAHRSGNLERSKLLLQRLMQEFPDHSQINEIRHYADPERPIQVGRMIPDFDWVAADGTGRHITSQGLKGSHTLFFVWDSRALTSSVFDELRKLQTTYQADGLTIVGIFAGKGTVPPPMATLIQSHPWPTVYSDGSPASPVAVLDNRVPFMILVAPDGSIAMINGGLNVTDAEKVFVQRIRK